MTTVVFDEIVQQLFDAEKNAIALPQFVEKLPNVDEAVAYDLQEALIRKKCKEEQATIAGWKLGLTSKAKQKMIGISEPSYGVLLNNMDITAEETHSLHPFIHAKIEPEIAFIFDKDIKGEYITPAQILDGVKYVMPAFEIIDSRFERFKFSKFDAIADNSSSSRFILGHQCISPKTIDLRLCGMVFRKNGEVVATSTGAAVMGNPLSAIAWMANKLAKRNQYIQEGQVVLSGSLSEAIEITPNDNFSAEFDGLGTVHAKFKG